jgi:hypothetical protein
MRIHELPHICSWGAHACQEPDVSSLHRPVCQGLQWCVASFAPAFGRSKPVEGRASVGSAAAAEGALCARRHSWRTRTPREHDDLSHRTPFKPTTSSCSLLEVWTKCRLRTTCSRSVGQPSSAESRCTDAVAVDLPLRGPFARHASKAAISTSRRQAARLCTLHASWHSRARFKARDAALEPARPAGSRVAGTVRRSRDVVVLRQLCCAGAECSGLRVQAQLKDGLDTTCARCFSCTSAAAKV